MHLIGFIIRICHDARSPERQRTSYDYHHLIHVPTEFVTSRAEAKVQQNNYYRFTAHIRYVRSQREGRCGISFGLLLGLFHCKHRLFITQYQK